MSALPNREVQNALVWSNWLGKRNSSMGPPPSVTFGFTAKQLTDEGRLTEEAISLIKMWSLTENLPKLTDEQVALFLLSCSNDQNLTKSTIKAFYSISKNNKELFNNRTLEREELRKQLGVATLCIFPERTDDDCAIVYCRFRDTNYRNFDMALFMVLLFMTVDATIHDNPPKGLIMYDMEGMGLMHLMKIRLWLVRAYFQYLQEGCPVKLKSIHMLNTVYFVNKLMALIRPFAKAEVLDNMHFHPRNMVMEEFYKTWLPRRCLPKDYGGYLPTAEALSQDTVQKLTEMQPYFEAEELQRRNIDNP